uniref:Uncharacterized protein n=2 Tax=Geospiza parvula TaxID=87175 RepID=A0A8U8BHS5_GEOPR
PEGFLGGVRPGPPRPARPAARLLGATPPQKAPPEEEQSGPFQSLERLRQRPLALAAFLQHCVLQFDSCPVLCYLHVDMLRSMNPKEGRKQFLEFCHLFLDKAGLLRVPIPHHVQFELERTRPELLPEEAQRRFLQDVQSHQEPEVLRQLQDFRSKRLMGMTPAEPELAELERSRARDPAGAAARERQLAERVLGRLEEMHLTISSDEEKSSQIFGAIVSYMKFLGLRTKGGDGKKPKSNFFRKKVRPLPKISPKNPPKSPPPNPPQNPPKIPKTNPNPTFSKGETKKGKPSSKYPPNPPKIPPKNPAKIPPKILPKSHPKIPPNPPKTQTPLFPQNRETPPQFPQTPAPLPIPNAPPTPREVVPRLEPELELEPPAWRELAAPEALLRLPQREVRRQEVINELFLTEHAHVRMLRVLLEVFFQPMLREGFFDEQELNNIFPSLEDLVEVHTVFLDSLKRRREESGFIIAEIGDVLLARFEGAEGSWFQKISSARFCSRQSFALEQLKAKQRKDARFSQFVQLKDIIPTEMQRLTKYPLLLLSVTKCTGEGPKPGRAPQNRPAGPQNRPKPPKNCPPQNRPQNPGPPASPQNRPAPKPGQAPKTRAPKTGRAPQNHPAPKPAEPPKTARPPPSPGPKTRQAPPNGPPKTAPRPGPQNRPARNKPPSRAPKTARPSPQNRPARKPDRPSPQNPAEPPKPPGPKTQLSPKTQQPPPGPTRGAQGFGIFWGFWGVLGVYLGVFFRGFSSGAFGGFGALGALGGPLGIFGGLGDFWGVFWGFWGPGFWGVCGGFWGFWGFGGFWGVLGGFWVFGGFWGFLGFL